MKQEEKELRRLVKKWLHHGLFRKGYKSWYDRRLHQELFQKDKVALAKTYLSKKGNMLDLGCGMGGAMVALQQAGFATYGLDFNFDYCRITNLRGKRYQLNTAPLNGQGEALPFKNNQFELIFCFDVLEHVQEPHLVLSEMYRVLKPGGGIVLTVINRFGFYDQHFYLPFINWLPRIIGISLVEFLSPKKHENFPDKQSLAEMHYFSYGKFTRIAQTFRFKTTDITLEKFLYPDKILDPQMRQRVKKLKFPKIIKILYWLYSRFFGNTFWFYLQKERKESPRNDSKSRN